MKRPYNIILYVLIIISVGSMVTYHITFKSSTKYLSKQQKIFVELAPPEHANELIEEESSRAYWINMGTIIFLSVLIISIYLFLYFTSRLPHILNSTVTALLPLLKVLNKNRK